jgi:hypothetical protein
MTEKDPRIQSPSNSDDDVAAFVIEGGCIRPIGRPFPLPPNDPLGGPSPLSQISNPHWDIAVAR